jgi:hypothetical protein
MPLNEIKKEVHFPGKGQNETLEIVIPVELTTAATESVKSHVPENGGT